MENVYFLYFFSIIAIFICWMLWEIHQILFRISNQNLQSYQALHDALVNIHKKMN